MIKKRKYIWLAAAIGLIIISAGIVYRFSAHGNRKENGLETAVAQKRDMGSSVQATGVLRAMVGAEVKVGARISGRVEHLYANIGDMVKKGAVIAVLEQKDLIAKVEQAKADLSGNRARLSLIETGARREEIGQARADVEQARANLELAKSNIERAKTLYAKDVVSLSQVDEAENQYKVASARLESAIQRLELLKEKYLPQEIDLARAQVEQANANLKFAEAQLSYATITAPIPGMIASVSTQEGETVSASSLNVPTFVTIVDLKRLEVAAYVDETDIGKIKAGQEATFTVDSYPDKDFRGKVTAIYPKAVLQENVVNYITTIAIENPEGKLKPDMTANVTIYLQKKSGVIAVPSSAVKREGGKKIVYILKDGKTVPREVRTGWKEGGFTEILSGLKEGEEVITGEVKKGE